MVKGITKMITYKCSSAGPRIPSELLHNNMDEEHDRFKWSIITEIMGISNWRSSKYLSSSAVWKARGAQGKLLHDNNDEEQD